MLRTTRRVRPRRVRALAAGSVAVAALLAGCGSGPTQAGAAAIVGDTRIPVDAVQQQVQDVLAREGEEVRAQVAADATFDDITRQVVTLRIRHELTQQAAQREGIEIDEQRVTELVESQGGAEEASAGTVFDAAGFRERARDQLVAVELGRRTLPGLAVVVDYTTTTSRDEARAKARELAAVGAEGARELVQADADAGVEAAVGERIVAAETPSFASAPVFGVDPGTVVAFTPDQTGGSWLVMVVRERIEDGDAAAGEEIDEATAEAAGIRQLAPVADEVGVRVSPRYGVWDPLTLQAAPNEDETGGFLEPLAGAPAA